MAGLPSLMQQPGQAPQPGQGPMLPGMAPQQGAATPSGVTGQLSQLPPQQLLSMYNNPQDMTPKWAVASAYAKAIEQQRAVQMAQGQGAMAQNAQQQQQLPVAQEVMSQAAQPQQPVMAALGGLMRGYAGGGAVAFRDAGLLGLQNPEYDEEGLPRTNAERQRIERNNRIFLEQQRNAEALKQRQAQTEAIRQTSSTVPQQMLDFYRSTGRDRPVTLGMQEAAAPSATTVPMRMQDTRGGTPEMAALAQMLGSGTATPSPSSAAGQRMQSAQPTTRPSTVGDAEMAALQQSLLNQQSNIRTLSQPSDEERLARQAARQAEADRLAQEREAARTFREASTKQYEDVQQRVNRPFLENQAAIAAFGSMLSPERGQLASGMLKGLGAIESSKQAQLESARKEMRDDQRTAMQMESVNRQLEVARQEKLYADMQGDRQGSLAAAEKIAALQQRQSELVYGHAVKKEELRNEGIKAQAAMLSAGKPSEMELALSRPEDYRRVMEMRAQAQQLKKSPEQIRSETIERYADNWEKLDMLQKRELATQGITNFQQYTRMRDQMAAIGGSPVGGKTMTMADVQATAAASGRTPEEVRKAAIAAGYTIQ